MGGVWLGVVSVYFLIFRGTAHQHQRGIVAHLGIGPRQKRARAGGGVKQAHGRIGKPFGFGAGGLFSCPPVWFCLFFAPAVLGMSKGDFAMGYTNTQRKYLAMGNCVGCGRERLGAGITKHRCAVCSEKNR